MEAHCFYRGEDRASACGPKAAQRRAPGRVGLGRVLPEHGEEKALTVGARAAEGETGAGCAGRGKKKNGPALRLWAAEEKRKREREKGEMGWAETREREKELVFHF